MGNVLSKIFMGIGSSLQTSDKLTFKGTVYLKSVSGLNSLDSFDGTFYLYDNAPVIFYMANNKIKIPMDNIAYLDGELERE